MRTGEANDGDDPTVNRAALVTGSTRGIGRAVAARLRADGTRVVVHGRDERAVDEAVHAVGAAAGVVGDVAVADDVLRLCDEAAAAVGPIDVLVNNAGTSVHHRFLESADAEWDQLLDVNLHGARHAIRAVLPGMLDRGWGRIVNVVSDAGIGGTPGYAAYAASKGALVALTLTLAQEVAGTGVHVNAFAPLALTDLVRSQVDEGSLERLTARGFPSVDDCAAELAPLVADDAPTGQVHVMRFGEARSAVARLRYE